MCPSYDNIMKAVRSHSIFPFRSTQPHAITTDKKKPKQPEPSSGYTSQSTKTNQQARARLVVGRATEPPDLEKAQPPGGDKALRVAIVEK
jgi:hypothetical protein